MKNLREILDKGTAPAKDFTPDNPVLMPNWVVTHVKKWLTQNTGHTNPYSSQFSTETQKECIAAYERGRLQLMSDLLEALDGNKETVVNKNTEAKP